MSAYVLLNLLNELGKRDKMRGYAALTTSGLSIYCMALFISQTRRHIIMCHIVFFSLIFSWSDLNTACLVQWITTSLCPG